MYERSSEKFSGCFDHPRKTSVEDCLSCLGFATRLLAEPGLLQRMSAYRHDPVITTTDEAGYRNPSVPKGWLREFDALSFSPETCTALSFHPNHVNAMMHWTFLSLLRTLSPNGRRYAYWWAFRYACVPIASSSSEILLVETKSFYVT